MKNPEFAGLSPKLEETVGDFCIELITQFNEHVESVAGLDPEKDFADAHANYLRLGVRLMEVVFPRRSIVRHVHVGRGVSTDLRDVQHQEVPE